MKGRKKKGLLPLDEEERLIQQLAFETARRKTAERSIRHIQRQFPKKSLIQLLPVILKYCGPFAAELAIERIERNQGDKLTPEDRFFLQEVKTQLKERGEKKNCLL